MKKCIIAALVVVTVVSGVFSAVASCRSCPNEECINAGYCVEACPNNCTPRRDGTGMHRGWGRGEQHGERHCGGTAYCSYR